MTALQGLDMATEKLNEIEHRVIRMDTEVGSLQAFRDQHLADHDKAKADYRVLKFHSRSNL